MIFKGDELQRKNNAFVVTLGNSKIRKLIKIIKTGVYPTHFHTHPFRQKNGNKEEVVKENIYSEKR